MKSTMGTITRVKGKGNATSPPEYWILKKTPSVDTANLAAFIFGVCRGWTATSESPLVDDAEYGFPISLHQFEWIGSAMALGCLLGSPTYGWAVTKFGRKRIMMIGCVPSTLGFTMIAFGQSATVICIGRVLTGIGIGCYGVAVPLYNGEFAETHIRGIIGVSFQILITSGILFTYVVGSLVSVFSLSAMCIAVPIIYVFLLLFIPESPIYYLEQNMEDKARKSLQWFRGSNYDIEEEFSIKKKAFEETKAAKLTMLEAFSSKAAKKGLIICIGIMCVRQLCGASGIIFYNTIIFKEAGSTLNPNHETIILGTVDLIFTIISSVLVDRLGRRPMLIFSSGGMAISTLCIGFYFTLKERDYDLQTLSWIPLVCLCVYIIAYSMGFGPLSWVLLGEIFPRKIAGYAATIVTDTNFFLIFIVTHYFEDVSSAIGRDGLFYFFSVCTTLGVVFIYCFVIETKNKPLEKILQELEK